ncbi:hypothetical protein OIU80_04015 [Flavobacterium sp. LS1R47]|uniref:Uncharacterized protein n=1 Tax=Flavobacterium frigoritolerans TaxID=2987686 RepID=A0A9X3C0U2_9FLAO|nr:hypothetical protein [Flavobacterium frigoritolerans]MCV9931436.1 hypothetical protein [Flavobacterium frigoritolerans]
MFRNFDNFNNLAKEDDLGQYFSYSAYNNDLLQLADFYGRTPFDWYRNKNTGQIIWLDGRAQIDHYSNLGHTWGKTFINGNRILLDGDTKLITYNGKVIHDFSKKSFSFGEIPKSFRFGGIAFSDRGNNQDPSSLRRGTRDATWIDFRGAFEALTIIMGFERRGSISKGKGTNGGKPTKENKTDDFITATDHSANAIKAGKSTYEEAGKKRDNTTPASAQKTEYIQIFNNPNDPNKNEYMRRDIYEKQQKKK